jgi:hypothetical protein
MNIGAKETCDYILLILNCHKYRHKASRQKEGWLKELSTIPNIRYYHIVGNIDGETKDEYRFDDTENILHVSCPDDYISLSKKVIMAIKAIHTRFDYKYIFKTDDDRDLSDPQFFNKLIPVCEQYKPNYGGYILIIPEHYSNLWCTHPELPKDILLESTSYASGHFYLLSVRAVEYLLKSYDKIWKRIIEDHAIGYYLSPDLNKLNVLGIPTEQLFIDYPEE